jgi:hypothetical protein
MNAASAMTLHPAFFKALLNCYAKTLKSLLRWPVSFSVQFALNPLPQQPQMSNCQLLLSALAVRTFISWLLMAVADYTGKF